MPHGHAQETPAALLRDLRALRADVHREGRLAWLEWRPRLHRPETAASLLNFAHYLALRRRDLRPLQDRLAPLGLSSLGRAEGHVLASIDAVLGALSRLVEPPGEARWPPDPRHFRRGGERLRANSDALFGPRPVRRATRIMATLSREAASDPACALALVRRGADLVRINCAHDSASEWGAMAAFTREAAQMAGRSVRILMDIAGPKLRTGDTWHPKGDKRLEVGDTLILVASEAALADDGASFAAMVEPAEILLRLAPGARVAIDDGLVEGTVEAIRADGAAVVRIGRAPEMGYKLKPCKGLNFPGTELGLAPLSARDLTDLDVIAAHADIVGHSFVNMAADVAALQRALVARRPPGARPLGLIAKIENDAAVRNLPEIVVQAAGVQPFGVMIARGDLAVEIGFARVAEMQEEVLWACEAAHVPVIWATQVLESLVKTGSPTRGEMTDAAMATRAECVMLNKGPYLLEAIDALDGLLVRMAEHQSKKTSRLRALRSWAG